MRTKVRQAQRSAEIRCVFCHGEFIDKEELSCQCGALYHPDCFQNYGCGTIGCSGIGTKARTQPSKATKINVRTKRLHIVSGIWLVGASIIGLLVVLCFGFHGSMLELALLLVGTIISCVLGFTFWRKAKKSEKSK